eukprot:CAMPEP_0170559390 /NCGR_PEP_ID=MMETSP0211-20121228/42391_1 /TAXON_ID=311385 /ORGANISM="Pseudokeronopsis sp., Strain OXSARD2" /LENGTH=95 /DNA_ID=CAMNT_0010872353 /DNA_START=258 /DNA_END=542 /DNA_ORIENTATION=+
MIKSLTEPDASVILVGNKLDLCEENPQLRQVPKIRAANFASKRDMLFMESSALDDINVHGLFETLIEEIYQSSPEEGWVSRKQSVIKTGEIEERR